MAITQVQYFQNSRETSIMDEVKASIKDMRDDIRLLSEAIRKQNDTFARLDKNIEKQTVLLDGHKELYAREIKFLQTELSGLKTSVMSNYNDLALLKADINKAKGAAGAAQVFWNIAWAVCGAVVSGVVMIFTMFKP